MEDLCRIEAGEQTFFLVTKTTNEGKDGFHLTLYDGGQVWSASVSKEEVLSMAKRVDMTIDEYVDQSIKNALTSASSCKGIFVYDAQKQGPNLQFSWKKKLGDGVKFQLGSVILKQELDNRKAAIEILNLAVNQITQHTAEISSLKSENDRLSSERKTAIKLLEKCTTAKNDMEKDVFQKFAAVLNEKKAKIRQLQSQVSYYSKDMTDEGQPTKKVQKRSFSESDSTGTRTPSPSPPDVSHNVRAEEDTSSTKSPLLLAEEEEEPMEMSTKRRRRRGPKKVTPRGKLLLPKVPAVKKTTSSSSEDSLSTPRQLRKSTSEKPSLDPDELMAEMGL